METKFDDRTLYAITDRRTGTVLVRPGGLMCGYVDRDDVVDIQVATRHQAEEGWQCPVHPSYKVQP